MTPGDFDALFDQFHRTVFRLEALPAYAVGGAEERRIEAWKAGQPRPERSVRTSPWMARIATSTVIGGKAWSRLRVVDEPLTEYQRYQLDSYRESQTVGEEIRLVRRAELGWPVLSDFWLFDAGTVDAYAALMHYGEEGQFEGAELVSAGDELLDDMVRVQRRLWSGAVPLAEFLAQVGRG